MKDKPKTEKWLAALDDALRALIDGNPTGARLALNAAHEPEDEQDDAPRPAGARGPSRG